MPWPIYAAARSILVCCAALTLATDVLAQDGKKWTPLPDHLPLGIDACFGRVYDAAHLKQHPKQRVTSFYIFRDFNPDPNSELEQETREQRLDADGTDGYVNVTAFVRFRDRKGVFSNQLSCRRSETGKIYCGIDCDGGSFNLRPNGPALLVDNEGFVVVGGCGASEEEQERPEFVAPGADDKTFRLDKQTLAQCTALREAQAPAWAKLGKPLRLRFDKSRATCHVRSYDAAHLRAHPQQKVRRIAVLNLAKDPAATDDAPNYRFIFRAEMRDGRKFETQANCSPDSNAYAYTCTPPSGPNDAQEFYLTRAGTGIMLRDRKGLLGETLDAEFGTDDRFFRLEPAAEIDCNL